MNRNVTVPKANHHSTPNHRSQQPDATPTAEAARPTSAHAGRRSCCVDDIEEGDLRRRGTPTRGAGESRCDPDATARGDVRLKAIVATGLQPEVERLVP